MIRKNVYGVKPVGDTTIPWLVDGERNLNRDGLNDREVLSRRRNVSQSIEASGFSDDGPQFIVKKRADGNVGVVGGAHRADGFYDAAERCPSNPYVQLALQRGLRKVLEIREESLVDLTMHFVLRANQGNTRNRQGMGNNMYEHILRSEVGESHLCSCKQALLCENAKKGIFCKKIPLGRPQQWPLLESAFEGMRDTFAHFEDCKQIAHEYWDFFPFVVQGACHPFGFGKHEGDLLDESNAQTVEA